MKTLAKLIAIVIFTAVFLISVSGLSVVWHYCSAAQNTMVSVYESKCLCNDNCEDAKTDNKRPSCCQQHKIPTSVLKSDCCTETVHFFKVAFLFVPSQEKIGFQAIAFSSSINYFNIFVSHYKSISLSLAFASPPKFPHHKIVTLRL